MKNNPDENEKDLRKRLNSALSDYKKRLNIALLQNKLLPGDIKNKMFKPTVLANGEKPNMVLGEK